MERFFFSASLSMIIEDGTDTQMDTQLLDLFQLIRALISVSEGVKD